MTNRQEILSPDGDDQDWIVRRSTQDSDLRINITGTKWFTPEEATAFAAAIIEVATSEDPSVRAKTQLPHGQVH